MRLIFTLFIFFVFSNSFAQTKLDFNSIPEICISHTVCKTDSLVFITITEKEFKKMQRRSVKIKKPERIAATLKDSTLIIRTKDSYYELPAGKAYEGSYDYVEYIPQLRSHHISHCGEGACFSELLDNDTDKKFYIPSFYDSGLIDLLISPSSKLMLVYSSYDGPDYADYYQNRATFILYKIDNTKGLEGLTLYREFETTEWSIEEIVWADTTTIALKIYTESATGDRKHLKYKYYKTDIK